MKEKRVGNSQHGCNKGKSYFTNLIASDVKTSGFVDESEGGL